jgi:hypothetical protein
MLTNPVAEIHLSSCIWQPQNIALSKVPVKLHHQHDASGAAIARALHHQSS